MPRRQGRRLSTPAENSPASQLSMRAAGTGAPPAAVTRPEILAARRRTARKGSGGISRTMADSGKWPARQTSRPKPPSRGRSRTRKEPSARVTAAGPLAYKPVQSRTAVGTIQTSAPARGLPSSSPTHPSKTAPRWSTNLPRSVRGAPAGIRSPSRSSSRNPPASMRSVNQPPGRCGSTNLPSRPVFVPWKLFSLASSLDATTRPLVPDLSSTWAPATGRPLASATRPKTVLPRPRTRRRAGTGVAGCGIATAVAAGENPGRIAETE